MKILVLAAQKGGSGKTTMAANIAVEAERAGDGPVALIDTDPQASLAAWQEERESERPALMHISPNRLSFQIRKFRDAGYELLIIDTPSAIRPAIAQVIGVSDLVVIPTRPSAHDLRAVTKTVEIAERSGKKFVFVVNGAHPKARVTVQSVLSLSEHGPVAPSIVHQRTDFAVSAGDGRTVMELSGRSRSPGEIAELWRYLKKCLYGAQPTRRAKGSVTQTGMASLASQAVA